MQHGAAQQVVCMSLQPGKSCGVHPSNLLLGLIPGNSSQKMVFGLGRRAKISTVILCGLVDWWNTVLTGTIITS